MKYGREILLCYSCSCPAYWLFNNEWIEFIPGLRFRVSDVILMAFHKYHTYEISPANSVDKVLFERLVFGGTFPQMSEIPPPRDFVQVQVWWHTCSVLKARQHSKAGSLLSPNTLTHARQDNHIRYKCGTRVHTKYFINLLIIACKIQVQHFHNTSGDS